MYSNHKMEYLKSIYLIYKNGLTFLFIFSVINLISSHILILNNLAEGLSALLADVIKTHGNNSKIKKFLKYKDYTKIETGILNTIKWFKKYKKIKIS